MTKTRKWVLIGIAVVFGLFVSCCGIGLLVPKKSTKPTKPVSTAISTVAKTATIVSTVAKTATLVATVANTATLVPTVKQKSIVATKQATMQIPTTVKPIATKALVSSADANPCQIGQIKGNPNGANGDKIYHLPTWRLYKKLQNNDVVCFDTIQDAQNAGYRPSKVK